MKAEYVDFKPDETKRNQSLMKRFVIYQKVCNLSEFILSIFAIYIILTIESSVMKWVMMFVVIIYLFSISLMVPVLVKNELEKYKK